MKRGLCWPGIIACRVRYWRGGGGCCWRRCGEGRWCLVVQRHKHVDIDSSRTYFQCTAIHRIEQCEVYEQWERWGHWYELCFMWWRTEIRCSRRWDSLICVWVVTGKRRQEMGVSRRSGRHTDGRRGPFGLYIQYTIFWLWTCTVDLLWIRRKKLHVI